MTKPLVHKPGAWVGPEGEALTPLLSMRAVQKSFGPTRAVQGVDFDVFSAEIVGLMGGNGAGKSTLMKLVGGLLAVDDGEVRLLDGQISSDYDPRKAMAAGVRFVHQELSLCSNLRVFENFAIELPDLIRGVRWKKSAKGFARAALEEVFPGCGIDPSAKISALSLSQQQMVEIARAVSHPGCRLVILDEPTSSLGSREAEQLREFMRRRRKEGLSFIFISHRLHETLDLVDRIVVMRNGRIAWAGASAGIDAAALIEMLGGRHGDGVSHTRDPKVAQLSHLAVEVTSFSQGVVNSASAQIRRGEIVGFAGLEGNGQRHVLQAIFDARSRTGGSITVQGRVAYISGDRASEGLFPLWSIEENVGLSSLSQLTKKFFLSLSDLHQLAERWFDKLKIRADYGTDHPVVSLSGGNQQKAIIGRALASKPDIILLDDPTRGVDLGTKSEIYQLFRELAAQGCCIIWYSTDDAEFLECDRTIVFRDGTTAEVIERPDVSLEKLVAAAFSGAETGGQSNAQLVAQRRRRREATVSTLIPLVTFSSMFAMCVALNPLIFTPFGLTLVFSAAFALAFAAISQLFIITAGDIDLGVGAFIGLVNAIAATWFVSDPVLAGICTVGLLAAYPLMGLFIEARRVPAIIVTLGLSFVWVGLATLRLPRPGGSPPEWMAEILQTNIPLITMPVLLCVLPALAAFLLLFAWRYGTVMRGYGANPKAIEAAGWSTRIAKASLYGFAGLFAFLAGILVTASTQGGDATGSNSMTLLSVAAVVLGGAAFTGGVVAPFGALFGTLTLVLVGTLLSLLGTNAVFLPMVQGLLLLAAVGVRTFLVRRGQ